MSYTDQDVERVAEALCVAEFDNEYWETLKDGADGAPDAHTYQREINHLRVLARAALEVMERETLEDVLHDLSPGTKICHVWPLLEGGYEAEIGVPVRQDPDGWWDHERSRGEGATIDEAIRAAVAEAQTYEPVGL